MRKETKCIQAGYTPGNGDPRMIPIIQSTTFRYDSSEAMGKLFDLEAEGYFYTRLQNPTNDMVAAKIAALEGGTAAMLTSSGQAASFFAVFNIAGKGDHVISSSTIYGGTFNLFNVTMRRMGVDFTFVDPDCSAEELEAAFRPNTKAVCGPRSRRSSDHRQHRRHTHQLQTLLMGRRHRDPLHDEVHGRPRHLRRRMYRGQR